MHVIFRENAGLDETDAPQDLQQTPADLVVLSFSDSDLNVFAKAWHGAGGLSAMPSLRLANLATLKHPLSVDTYIDQTLTGAKGILIRLIGGQSYWPYGLQSVQDLARRNNIALAILPADGRPDPQLDALSTVPQATLRRLTHFIEIGGEEGARAALSQMALASGLYAKPDTRVPELPDMGVWCAEKGILDPDDIPVSTRPLIVMTFYRSFVVSADLAAIRALFSEFDEQGYECIGLFAPSLKSPKAAEWLKDRISQLQPVAIVNATAFSGKGRDGTSPLDVANVPVFQVALATSDRAAWDGSDRGLSPTDLAMHVVLPEVDGRIFLGPVSFKEKSAFDPDLQFACLAHVPDAGRVRVAVSRVHAWVSLAAKSAPDRRIALVLSTYPGKSWQDGHAVGLDAIASATCISEDLKNAGYTIHDVKPDALRQHNETLPVSDYLAYLARIPQQARDDLFATWGDPQDDPACVQGAFQFHLVRSGMCLAALQPERGDSDTRSDDYHDLARVPRHHYVAFYLWLQQQADAMVHIGAHGTLEWLPGKSVALSATCWPEILTGDMPVIYPFIVNDPGEAAQAKRRIGAVTLGHVPPPLIASETPQNLVRLEALLDEFSNADGLDPKRRDRLQADIRDEAAARGVEADLGVTAATCEQDAIARIDRFVCDIKESQFGSGLHIWGRAGDHAQFDVDASAKAEKHALIDALDGKRIAAGPSGSPYRGRLDVLPTGRNMFTTDPRSVPSRAAFAQGQKLAQDLVRRHMQDHGDVPRGLVIDLWGSATMRTAGEEFAIALALMGVKPDWDDKSERVSGIEVLPLAELEFPRIDVTLRISGLFRDVFPTLSALFNLAQRKLAERDEDPSWNPYVGRADIHAVYGPKPGHFGMSMGGLDGDFSDSARDGAGQAWLSASSWAFDGDTATYDPTGITDRIAASDVFLHVQDLPETDLLMAADYAAHEAGFVAAKALVGGDITPYHVDTTRPDATKVRTLQEEIARVVQARASNPNWINGMMAHGARGGAEIAATLDHLAAFAHLTKAVGPHLFDLYFDATLANETVKQYLRDENPAALQAMIDRFQALRDAGLWATRRNAIIAELEMLL